MGLRRLENLQTLIVILIVELFFLSGLVLQDLTFVHIGNPDLLPDGSINFTKRWQQYHIMENMKRFHKECVLFGYI